jgi:hypothetical protein
MIRTGNHAIAETAKRRGYNDKRHSINNSKRSSPIVFYTGFVWSR